jgi:hypothetical protein
VTINKRYKLSSNLSKKEDILLNYMTYINNRCILERENEILKLTINKVCYEIFGFTISEIELLESSDEVAYEDGIEYKLILSNNYKPLSENQMKEVLGELESQIKPTDLIYMHSVNGLNMDIKTIAEKYNCRYSTLTLLREKYLQKYSNLDEWKFYNLTELYETINFEIKERCILIFKMKSEALNPLQLLDSLKVLFEKFEQLIEILRIDNHNKKSLELVKQAVNEDSFTWNAYRKVKSKGKVDKVFIKYDGNNYGLAEWPDEIHKNYFLDAIEEYTVNNPNEKKAKDVLKLFKDLDIEDKQDYIEVIEEKIRKTFK